MKIEFSFSIAYGRIIWRHLNRTRVSDKEVKYGRFCHNNSKLYLLLYVQQRNVATAVLV